MDLSFLAQKLLESFSSKPFYQVLEIIEYTLKHNPQESNYLLQIFYSIAASMQNNTNTDFFGIWIYDITFKEISRFNRLSSQKITETYLRIACFSVVKPKKKKRTPLVKYYIKISLYKKII